MKIIFTFLLLCGTMLVNGQSISEKLAGLTERKWVGQTVYSGEDELPNTSTLVFSRKHTLTRTDTRTHKATKMQWLIEKGDYPNDADIVILLGKDRYHVEFSTSSNGKEMLILANVPAWDEEPITTRTYYLEN